MGGWCGGLEGEGGMCVCVCAAVVSECCVLYQDLSARCIQECARAVLSRRSGMCFRLPVNLLPCCPLLLFFHPLCSPLHQRDEVQAPDLEAGTPLPAGRQVGGWVGG